MYRNHGIPLAFGIEGDNDDKKTRNLGELVALDENGNVVVEPEGTEGIFFPLIADIKADDKDASVTVLGVAKVYVEDANGINAGSSVGLGATFKGAALHTDGCILGVALAKPKGDGDFIPVLLTHEKSESIY